MTAKIAKAPLEVLCEDGKADPWWHHYLYGTWNLCPECRRIEEASMATNRFPPIPENATSGEKYGPAMEIRSRPEAAEYFERLVEHSMKAGGLPREEAEKVERSNLGYFCGYYSPETMKRVFDLFSCAHPFFGTTTPTPGAALQMGLEAGRRSGDRPQSGEREGGKDT